MTNSLVRRLNNNFLPSDLCLFCNYEISFMGLLWGADPPDGRPRRSTKLLKKRSLVPAVCHRLARTDQKQFGVSSA